MNTKTVTFKNGWFAEYDAGGKWALFDNTKDQNLIGVDYLEAMIKQFNLERV